MVEPVRVRFCGSAPNQARAASIWPERAGDLSCEIQRLLMILWIAAIFGTTPIKTGRGDLLSEAG